MISKRYHSIKCMEDDKNHTFIHSTYFLSLLHVGYSTRSCTHSEKTISLYSRNSDLWVREVNKQLQKMWHHNVSKWQCQGSGPGSVLQVLSHLDALSQLTKASHILFSPYNSTNNLNLCSTDLLLNTLLIESPYRCCRLVLLPFYS